MVTRDASARFAARLRGLASRLALRVGLMSGLLLGLPAALPAGGPRGPATGELPGALALPDLERLVLQQDPGIASVQARLDEARGQIDETASRFGPVFDARYSRYPTGGDVPDDQGRIRRWFSAGLRQDYLELLEVKPYRMAEKEAGVEGAQALVHDAEREALYEVRLAYLDLVEASMKADHYTRLASIREELFDIRTRRRVSRADLPPVLLESRQALIEAEGERRLQIHAAERQRALLAHALGVPGAAIVVELPDRPPPLPSEDSLAVLARRNRGEIRMLEANARSEQARAEAAPWEDVHLSSFVGYRVRDDAISGTGSGLGIGVTFTMPLRFRGIGNGRRERFLSRERHWQEEARKARLDVDREIHRAYLEYARETERSLLAENETRLASERLRIERLRFAEPVPGHETDLVTIRQIEAGLVMREIDLTAGRCDALRAAWKLLYLAGLHFPEEFGTGVEYASFEASAARSENRPSLPEPEPVPGLEPASGATPASPSRHPDRVAGTSADSSTAGGVVVQVIACSTRKAARRMASALTRAGWFAWIEAVGEAGSATYRVRVGFFDTEESAREATRKISATFDLPEGWVTIPPAIELSRAGRKR